MQSKTGLQQEMQELKAFKLTYKIKDQYKSCIKSLHAWPYNLLESFSTIDDSEVNWSHVSMKQVMQVALMSIKLSYHQIKKANSNSDVR